MLSRRVGLVAVAGALLGACTGGSADDGGQAGTEQWLNRIEQVPIELAISIEGDLNIEFAQTIKTQLILRRPAGEGLDDPRLKVLGVEPVEPVRHGAGAFLAGLSLLPFEGDGTYTIPVGSPIELAKQTQPGQGGPVASSIKVDWWPTGDVASAPETFMRRAAPCSVVVTGGGTRGTLTCPHVTNEAQNRHFSFTLRWVAPEKAAPTTTPLTG